VLTRSRCSPCDEWRAARGLAGGRRRRRRGDFTSLNFAWRYLVDPEAPFTIGVLDPTFKPEGELLFYRGDARIEYVGEERLHGKQCRRYRISGPGIGDTTGSLWAPVDGEWLERIEIPFPDNPDWKSFRLELQGKETMTPEAWKRFIARSLKKANGS